MTERTYRAGVEINAEKESSRGPDRERSRERRSARDTDWDDDFDSRDERRTRGRRFPLLGFTPETVADYYRGLARAIAEGLRTYERELEPESLYRPDGSGVAESVLSGYATFWEQMARATRRTLDDLRDDLRWQREKAQELDRERRERRRARSEEWEQDQAPEPAEARSSRGSRLPPIDYERLAHLVAQELEKSKHSPTIITSPEGTTSV
jgi:hypothetical protein